MVVRLKRIDPIPLAFLCTIIAGTVGFVGAVVVLVAQSLSSTPFEPGLSSRLGQHPFPLGAGSFLTVGTMLLLVPFWYGFMGFFGGLIPAVCYNLLAKVTGGIQLTVAVEPVATPAAAGGQEERLSDGR